jgi:hypothetical protein
MRDVYHNVSCYREMLREKRFKQINEFLMPSSRRKLKIAGKTDHSA